MVLPDSLSSRKTTVENDRIVNLSKEIKLLSFITGGYKNRKYKIDSLK
jgi:hypothetical protein